MQQQQLQQQQQTSQQQNSQQQQTSQNEPSSSSTSVPKPTLQAGGSPTEASGRKTKFVPDPDLISYHGQPSVEFEVDLDKQDGGLGLDVYSSTTDKLLISRIKMGIVLMSNRENPDKAIWPGDQIRKVNGSEGSAHELTEMVKASRRVLLTIFRQIEYRVTVIKRGRLGLDVAQYANSLRILSILEGPFQAWNEKAPTEEEVRTGDHLVEVDGIRGTCTELLSYIKGTADGSSLKIVFVRGSGRRQSASRDQATSAGKASASGSPSQQMAITSSMQPRPSAASSNSTPAQLSPPLKSVAPWAGLSNPGASQTPQNAAGQPTRRRSKGSSKRMDATRSDDSTSEKATKTLLLPPLQARNAMTASSSQEQGTPTSAHRPPILHPATGQAIGPTRSRDGATPSAMDGGWRSPLASFGLNIGSPFRRGSPNEAMAQEEPSFDVVADMV